MTLLILAVAVPIAINATNKALDVALHMKGVVQQKKKSLVSIDMVLDQDEFEALKKSDAWHIIERGQEKAKAMSVGGGLGTCTDCGRLQ